jgi:hypothetical protein
MSNHDQERLAVFAQILREQTSASSRSQQQRLATALTTLGNITTIEAREFLNVMHPSGRINELRNQGWGIEPPRVRYVDDCGVVHSIANYVLKSLPVRSAA